MILVVSHPTWSEDTLLKAIGEAPEAPEAPEEPSAPPADPTPNLESSFQSHLEGFSQKHGLGPMRSVGVKPIVVNPETPQFTHIAMATNANKDKHFFFRNSETNQWEHRPGASTPLPGASPIETPKIPEVPKPTPMPATPKITPSPVPSPTPVPGTTPSTPPLNTTPATRARKNSAQPGLPMETPAASPTPTENTTPAPKTPKMKTLGDYHKSLESHLPNFAQQHGLNPMEVNKVRRSKSTGNISGVATVKGGGVHSFRFNPDTSEWEHRPNKSTPLPGATPPEKPLQEKPVEPTPPANEPVPKKTPARRTRTPKEEPVDTNPPEEKPAVPSTPHPEPAPEEKPSPEGENPSVEDLVRDMPSNFRKPSSNRPRPESVQIPKPEYVMPTRNRGRAGQEFGEQPLSRKTVAVHHDPTTGVVTQLLRHHGVAGKPTGNYEVASFRPKADHLVHYGTKVFQANGDNVAKNIAGKRHQYYVSGEGEAEGRHVDYEKIHNQDTVNRLKSVYGQSQHLQDQQREARQYTQEHPEYARQSKEGLSQTTLGQLREVRRRSDNAMARPQTRNASAFEGKQAEASRYTQEHPEYSYAPSSREVEHPISTTGDRMTHKTSGLLYSARHKGTNEIIQAHQDPETGIHMVHHIQLSPSGNRIIIHSAKGFRPGAAGREDALRYARGVRMGGDTANRIASGKDTELYLNQAKRKGEIAGHFQTKMSGKNYPYVNTRYVVGKKGPWQEAESQTATPESPSGKTRLYHGVSPGEARRSFAPPLNPKEKQEFDQILNRAAMGYNLNDQERRRLDQLSDRSRSTARYHGTEEEARRAAGPGGTVHTLDLPATKAQKYQRGGEYHIPISLHQNAVPGVPKPSRPKTRVPILRRLTQQNSRPKRMKRVIRKAWQFATRPLD